MTTTTTDTKDGTKAHTILRDVEFTNAYTISAATISIEVLSRKAPQEYSISWYDSRDNPPSPSSLPVSDLLLLSSFLASQLAPSSKELLDGEELELLFLLNDWIDTKVLVEQPSSKKYRRNEKED